MANSTNQAPSDLGLDCPIRLDCTNAYENIYPDTVIGSYTTFLNNNVCYTRIVLWTIQADSSSKKTKQNLYQTTFSFIHFYFPYKISLDISCESSAKLLLQQ